MVKALKDYAEDLLILGGLVCINVATFRLGVTPGLYGLGITCLVVGLLAAWTGGGRRANDIPKHAAKREKRK
jgi:hypothetical protein